jgi:hypothetical protein
MDNYSNDLTATGDGSSQPDTKINATDTTNTDADAHDQSEGSQSSQPKPNISEARLLANRANAEKSTGPKTVLGKRQSSFNSIKHGLLARKVMFSADGKFNEEVHRVFESFREHFGCDDVVTDVLVELLATDYWRLQAGLKFEIDNANSKYGFHARGITDNLVRYTSMNRRSFEKTLQTLLQMQVRSEQRKADQTDVIEGDSSTDRQAEEDKP